MFNMDTFPVYTPRVAPKAEPFVSCRRSCKGCCKAMAARMASKVINSEPFSHALLPSAHHSLCSHTYSQRLDSNMFVPEPLATNRQSSQELLRVRRLDVCQVALLVHPIELANKRVNLASLRRIDEHVVPVARECICRGNTKLHLVCGKRSCTSL